MGALNPLLQARNRTLQLKSSTRDSVPLLFGTQRERDELIADPGNNDVCGRIHHPSPYAIVQRLLWLSPVCDYGTFLRYGNMEAILLQHFHPIEIFGHPRQLRRGGWRA